MNDAWAGRLCLVFAGSLYFPFIYHTIKYFLNRYCKHRFSVGEIYLICEKCTCSIQAIMSVVIGAIIVSQVEDIMLDTHWLTNSYAWFGIPYFLHDVYAMFMTFKWHETSHISSLAPTEQFRRFVQDTPLLLVHHLIMPIIIFPMIVFYRNNLGDFFVGTIYMIEVTIPFISARTILAQLQMKNSPYYIIVGLSMLASFFCARVLVFPFLYWRYAIYSGIGIMEVPGSIPIKCNLSSAMILLPQLYWFYLMLRGTVRVFYKIYTGQNSKSHGN